MLKYLEFRFDFFFFFFHLGYATFSFLNVKFLWICFYYDLFVVVEMVMGFQLGIHSWLIENLEVAGMTFVFRSL